VSLKIRVGGSIPPLATTPQLKALVDRFVRRHGVQQPLVQLLDHVDTQSRQGEDHGRESRRNRAVHRRAVADQPKIDAGPELVLTANVGLGQLRTTP
jgi:hypothetical protein